MGPALATMLTLAAPSQVYTPTQAVEDVLSGPLEYVGRGPWFGMARWEACVYRNRRVWVVDIYCARDWPQAFSVRVFSPARGRIKLYVETEKPANELPRSAYDDSTWKLESEPGPPGVTKPLALDMTMDELRDYEKTRYGLYLPACYIDKGTPRCHRKLATAESAWKTAAGPFWKKPGASWYRLIKRMRALAEKNGT